MEFGYGGNQMKCRPRHLVCVTRDRARIKYQTRTLWAPPSSLSLSVSLSSVYCVTRSKATLLEWLEIFDMISISPFSCFLWPFLYLPLSCSVVLCGHSTLRFVVFFCVGIEFGFIWFEMGKYLISHFLSAPRILLVEVDASRRRREECCRPFSGPDSRSTWPSSVDDWLCFEAKIVIFPFELVAVCSFSWLPAPLHTHATHTHTFWLVVLLVLRTGGRLSNLFVWLGDVDR